MTSSESLKNYLKRPPKPFNPIIENDSNEDYFQGLHIEKPESLTPIEMELRIQADRVMFSLRKAISVLNVMTYIPFLLENKARRIWENFTQEEAQFIMNIFETYQVTESVPDNISTDTLHHNYGELYDLVNKTRVTKSRLRSSELDSALDPNLSQVIYMIFTNKCIRKEIKNAIGPTKLLYINRFIMHMEELQEVAKLKLYVTGMEEEARDKRLRQAYKSNVMLTAAIKDLEQQLENQREQLGHELSEKVDTFEKYNKKIAGIKEEFQISIEKNVHESERKMMHQCIESEEKQSVLVVDAEEITRQFDLLLAHHLNEERNLRIKRSKTETELQKWLAKYDQDIGDKQAEYEKLKKEHDDEKEALDDLEDKMDDQEREYNTLMAAKAEEEERIYMELAYKLLVNRSARIIQRCWRAYRERRSKRRGKKGKKGKDASSKPKLRVTKKEDPNAVLSSKFKGDVFEELKNPDAFS